MKCIPYGVRLEPEAVLLLGLGWSSYLVGGVMTPPYQVPNL